MPDQEHWIEECRSFAEANDLQAVAVITVSRDGTVGAHSYGETRKKCRAIGEWIQGYKDRIVSVVPFQTVFGWGFNGQPEPLSRAQYESLTENGKAYANRHNGRPR